MLAFAFVSGAVVPLLLSMLCSAMLALGLRLSPDVRETCHLDLTVAEELPPMSESEPAPVPDAQSSSASLRLAMAVAPSLRHGLPLLGLGLLALAYARNDGFFWALSLLCTIASLPLLRPRPGDPAGFDWNGEVHGIEVAQFGLVVLGGLALMVAYLLNSVLLASLSIGCTVLLAVSMPLARRIPARFLEVNPEVPARDLASVTFAMSGLLSLIVAYVLDDWTLMQVSLGCALMAASGLLGSLRVGAVAIGFTTLAIAYLEGSAQAFALSVACSASVLGAIARESADRRKVTRPAVAPEVARPRAEDRDVALSLGLPAVLSGLLALAIAYMDDGSWLFFGISGACTAVAALALGAQSRAIPREDADAIGMDRSRDLGWDEAVQRAEQAVDAGEPLIEARLASVPPLSGEDEADIPQPLVTPRPEDGVEVPPARSRVEETPAPAAAKTPEELRAQFRPLTEVFGAVRPRVDEAPVPASPPENPPSASAKTTGKGRGRRGSSRKTPAVVDKAVPRVTARLDEKSVPMVTARLDDVADEKKTAAGGRRSPGKTEPQAAGSGGGRGRKASSPPAEAKRTRASRAEELELPFQEPPPKGRGRRSRKA